MENYISPEDAMSDLEKKGYKANLDFETDPFGLYSGDLDMRLNPEAYHVDQRIHFEEPFNPDGNEDVYAITSSSGEKGFLDVHEGDADSSKLSKLAGIIQEHKVEVDQYLRQAVRISGMMPEHSDLISHSPIIEFTDWAAAERASVIWDKLYTDLIKHLEKRDFHFLFHLGDVVDKLVFEIDEVLDIMGDYSSHGKVVLMLDEKEADHLWCKLNGRSPGAGIPGSPQTEEKYRSLFNTMNIDALVVLHDHSAVQLSRDGEIVLSGVPSVKEPANVKMEFSAGYGIGLLLHLEPRECMALGLSGAYKTVQDS